MPEPISVNTIKFIKETSSTADLRENARPKTIART